MTCRKCKIPTDYDPDQLDGMCITCWCEDLDEKEGRTRRFFVTFGDGPEQEVDEAGFVDAERKAGFVNTLGRPDKPGTAGFSHEGPRGRISGRIEYHQRPQPPARTYEALTVGQLRDGLTELPDDTIVAIWSVPSAGYVRASGITWQTSDAVPGPAGTDPKSEPTVSLFLIDSKEDENGGCM